MKFLYLFILSALVCSCDILEDDKPYQIDFDPKKIVLEASAFAYPELPAAAKEKASNSYIFKQVGEEAEEIKKEEGYYLRLIVDNTVLAKASTSRGMWKENVLLDSSNFSRLYGKYQNTPYLYNASGEVIEMTRKHEGYNLVTVSRSKNIDTSFWGPVKELPVKLVLACSSLDSVSHPTVSVTRK